VSIYGEYYTPDGLVRYLAYMTTKFPDAKNIFDKNGFVICDTLMTTQTILNKFKALAELNPDGVMLLNVRSDGVSSWLCPFGVLVKTLPTRNAFVKPECVLFGLDMIHICTRNSNICDKAGVILFMKGSTRDQIKKVMRNMAEWTPLFEYPSKVMLGLVYNHEKIDVLNEVRLKETLVADVNLLLFWNCQAVLWHDQDPLEMSAVISDFKEGDILYIQNVHHSIFSPEHVPFCKFTKKPNGALGLRDGEEFVPEMAVPDIFITIITDFQKPVEIFTTNKNGDYQYVTDIFNHDWSQMRPALNAVPSGNLLYWRYLFDPLGYPNKFCYKTTNDPYQSVDDWTTDDIIEELQLHNYILCADDFPEGDAISYKSTEEEIREWLSHYPQGTVLFHIILATTITRQQIVPMCALADENPLYPLPKLWNRNILQLLKEHGPVAITKFGANYEQFAFYNNPEGWEDNMARVDNIPYGSPIYVLGREPDERFRAAWIPVCIKGGRVTEDPSSWLEVPLDSLTITVDPENKFLLLEWDLPPEIGSNYMYDSHLFNVEIQVDVPAPEAKLPQPWKGLDVYLTMLYDS
jgi:hypothetical protein